MKKLFTPIVIVLLMLTLPGVAVPKLSSYPSATATIFLDFDGHRVSGAAWNSGTPLNCAPSGMSDTEITEAFNRTAEDYRPFNINITTDSTVFLAAPLSKRIRIIVTPTSSWYPGVGGVAYVGSFNWGDDTPGFVFCDRLGPNSPKMVGECCSHESGHTVGLSHQSKYDVSCVTPVEQYNSGTGSGEPGWAPIMGNSYYKNMSNWNNGPTPYGCTNIQDNLSIITTTNSFGYRTDDYSDTLNAATTFLAGGNFIKSGIISTNADKDAFAFTIAQNASFHLTAIPFNVGANNLGANLDIKMEIYNGAGALINTYDPAAAMSVIIDTVLNTGTYYIKIDGSGNINTGEYGSLGSYTITGINAILPIKDVALSGNTDNNKHNLNWGIVADEAIKTIVVETAADGIHFNRLVSLTSGTKFSYSPLQNGSLYYRLKVTSVLDHTLYSNTIFLKGINPAGDNNFTVSTFIRNEIMVNAAVPFQYQLIDINGRTITKGAGATGVNHLSISNQPNGIYIIKIFSNNKEQTERIIKQ
jgi:hypothetical protein